MQKFRLLYMPFPDFMKGNIWGCVMRKKGVFAIFIDSQLSEQDQAFALRHELAHMVLNHHDAEFPGDGFVIDSGFYISESQEAEANEYAERMTDAELSQLMEYAASIKRVGAECLPLFTQNGIS